jgi:hypothetical protein
MAKYYHEPSSLARDLLARVEVLEATSGGGQSSEGLATLDMLEDAVVSLSTAIADLNAQVQTLINRIIVLEGGEPLPDQSGQAGRVLSTDGGTAYWDELTCSSILCATDWGTITDPDFIIDSGTIERSALSADCGEI